MYDTLLFPGQLQVERDHCLTPVKTIHPEYLQVENALSEFDTEHLKEKARENLGIEWGNIKGNIEDQEDLISCINSTGIKLETIDKLPTEENLISETNQKISIYELLRDSDILENYLSYGRNEAFKVKAGDLLLTAKYEKDNIESKVESAEIPYLTTNLANKKVNIVFDNGDYELGVTQDGVRTVYRQLEPTWLLEPAGQTYKLKHINTGLYLQKGTSIYELGSTGDYFLFSNKPLSDGRFIIGELMNVLTGSCLNMRNGSGINRQIADYTPNDPNNKLHIIDPSKYILPLFSTKPLNLTYYYSIHFKSSGGVINSNVVTALYTKDDGNYWALIGNPNNFTLYNKDRNMYLGFNLEICVLSSEYSVPFILAPCGYDSINTFEIVPKDSPDFALNLYRYLPNQLGKSIAFYRRHDNNNKLSFLLRAQDTDVLKIIATNEATRESTGLMSAKDKKTLDYSSVWIDVIN